MSWLCTDRLGRRRLFLAGLAVITASYIVSAAVSDAYPNDVNRGANVVGVVCIYLIQCSCAGALSALQWVIVGEIFPGSYREKCINICQALGQQVTQLWLNQVWLVMFDALSHNAYWVMAGFNVVCFVLFYWLYPETRGVPLEQIDAVFGEENRVQRADADLAESKAAAIHAENAETGGKSGNETAAGAGGVTATEIDV